MSNDISDSTIKIVINEVLDTIEQNNDFGIQPETNIDA